MTQPGREKERDERERRFRCNGSRRKKRTQRSEFKSQMGLFAFHITLIRLQKVSIELFSVQL